MSLGRKSGLTYPADGFQGRGIDLVYVVDLGGSVVVLAVADDVDQVVVSEVGDDVGKVRQCPGDKGIWGFQSVSHSSAQTSPPTKEPDGNLISSGPYLEKMFLQGSG